MKILISNDDGYRADGLTALSDALAQLAEITVVAPDRNRSGASNSLTLDMPLRVLPFGERKYYVLNGTPTDCVHLAISGLFEEEHDMVVSGINDGPNLGDDVLYSGTVAAAIEGRFLGLPAIALSLVIEASSGRHFATAARVATELVLRVQRAPLHQATILNVNVPDVPYESLKGYQATRLGFRHRSERIIAAEDPRGRPCIGSARGRRPGRRARHRLPRGREQLRVGDAAADRPDSSFDAGGYARVAAGKSIVSPPLSGNGGDQPGNRAGIGMTSARTRERLIQRLREQGINNAQVLDQIRNVPRHLFVDEALATRAYEDTALPIGHGQTISQPFVVAKMSEAMLEGGTPGKVLEIGTGCGYQTAVLAPLVRFIYSIERISALLERSRSRFKELGIRNVHLRHGDGFQGWPAHGPYDGILMAAAPLAIPEVLFQQLAPGGRLIAPVGPEGRQQLLRLTRRGDELAQGDARPGQFRALVEGHNMRTCASAPTIRHPAFRC